MSLRRPRMREAPKKFGARAEAIFSARLTMHTGSDSQSADDAHRLLPFPGAARSQGRAWNGHTRGAIYCFRCWCEDRHLLRLHQRPLGRAVGSSPIEDHRFDAMVGLELGIAGGGGFHLSSSGKVPELAADASRDAIDASPIRQKALPASKGGLLLPLSPRAAFRLRTLDLSVSAVAAKRDRSAPLLSQCVPRFRC